MKNVTKKIFVLLFLISSIFSASIFANTEIENPDITEQPEVPEEPERKALEKFYVEVKDSLRSTEAEINLSTYTGCEPPSTYDFFDEYGYFNTVFTSWDTVYWSKLDNDMNVISTVSWPYYYLLDNEENPPPLADTLTCNFGNAIYYNGYVYVIYSRMASYTSDETEEDIAKRDSEKVMAIVKYDKEGNIVAENEFLGIDLNASSSSRDSGTCTPFFGSNCSLAANNGIITCFFGRNMYNGHQASLAIYIDADTLEFVSNLRNKDLSLDNTLRYYGVYDHYISHSLGQRIIPTSDGQFLMMESGDAGLLGSTRGLNLTKIYETIETGNVSVLKKSTKRMVHYSEGCADEWGYNNTYSVLGNIIELSDGYMYVGGLEKTLSRAYGNNMNEPWNIFVQKYTKDFYTKDSIKDMQLLDASVRVASGTPAEYNGEGKLFLKGNEEDYGMKWLTNFKDKSVILVRAVKAEDKDEQGNITRENVVILWEEFDIEKWYHDDRYQGYKPVRHDRRNTYYMVIDKDGNVVRRASPIEGVRLNGEELYQYKDGKVYWTSCEGYLTTLDVNVLDVYAPLEFIKGDMNKDGKVNATDAAMVLDRYKYKNPTDEDMKIGDMNDDKKLNATDAALILDVYKNKKN